MKQLLLAILLPLILGVGGMFLYLRLRPSPTPQADAEPESSDATQTQPGRADPVATQPLQSQPAQLAQPAQPAQPVKPVVPAAPPIGTTLKEGEWPVAELLAYKPKAVVPMPVPAISSWIQNRIAGHLETLKSKPADKTALLGVMDGLTDCGVHAPAVPYFERYLAAGFTLTPHGKRSYAAGLRDQFRFGEALDVLEKLDRENGGFPFTGRDEMEVYKSHCEYTFLVSGDVIEACQSFVLMNSCAPNAPYIDVYEVMSDELCEAVFNSAKGGKLDAQTFEKIDSVWPFLPGMDIQALAVRLKQIGIKPSAAFQAACDEMNMNRVASPAAFIRRAAYMRTRNRDFGMSMKLADRSLQLARQLNDKQMLLEALWCVAEIALKRADLQKLYNTTNEAGRLAKELGQTGRVAVAAIKFGRMYEELGDFKAAAIQYAQAVEMGEKNNESFFEIEDPQIMLNTVRCALGQAADVEKYMRDRTEWVEKVSMGPGQRCLPYYNLGICLTYQKKYEQAIQAFKRSMESNDFDYRMLSSIVVGRNYLALKNGQQAEEAFGDAERYEAMVSNRDSRWAWQFGRSQALLMRSDKQGSQTFLNAALKTIEEQRASISDYNSRRTLQDNKYEVYEYAIKLALERNDPEAAFALTERSRSRTFLDLVGENSGVAPALADLQGVRAACKNFAAVIYFQCKTNLLVWIVRKDTSEMITLPLSEQMLSESIQQLHRSMLSPSASAQFLKGVRVLDWRSVTQAVYRDLWQPIEKKLRPNERVCIVPHGVLHYVPFQALNDGKSFLVETHEIFYAPSGSGLLALANHKGSPASGIVLFDPIRSSDPNSPFSKTETEAIARLYPEAQRAIGKDGTLSNFKRAVSDVGIIHISSHGYFNPWIPIRSGLVFSKETDDEGILTAADVFKMKLTRGSLVVMSACVSSVGELSGGDEVTGLTRAFQVAGADNVIGSLWPVDNAATTRLMGMFYEELKQNPADPARALCKSQRCFLSADPTPSLWAAFELSGTGVSESK